MLNGVVIVHHVVAPLSAVVCIMTSTACDCFCMLHRHTVALQMHLSI